MKKVIFLFVLFLISSSTSFSRKEWVKLEQEKTHARFPRSIFAFGTAVIVWDFDDTLRLTCDNGLTWCARPIVLILDDGKQTIPDYVWFYNQCIGYAFSAMGGKPYLYKTTDQGQTWVLSYKNTASIPNQHNTWEMQFLDANTGYFLSGNRDIYKTTDGGSTFNKLNIPHNSNGYDFVSIYGFKFFDVYNGYVVGAIIDNSSIYKYNAAFTTDGGNTWKPITIPWRKDAYTCKEIHAIDISKTNKNEVWVGGVNSSYSGQGGKLQHTTNAFSSSPLWTSYLFFDEPEGASIRQIQIVDNGYIWAQDTKYIYYFKDMNHYQRDSLPGTGWDSYVYCISMSGDSGWAVVGNNIWHYTNIVSDVKGDENNRSSYLKIAPNQYGTNVSITVSLNSPSPISLFIVNSLGQEVCRIFENEYLEQGEYNFDFNSLSLEPGTYFCVLKSRDSIQTQKFILIR